MKVTIKQLKQIIREEIYRLNEDMCPCGIERADCDYHKPEQLATTSGHLWPTGTRVRVTYVDPYGFTGRDPHPTKGDEGKTGTIVSVTEDSRDPDHPIYPADEEDENYVAYEVELDDGRSMNFVNFELERI